MKITTDHKWRYFKYAYEVPGRVIEQHFDYQDKDDVTDGFFRYRGCWYHLDQFMHLEKHNPLAHFWDGYLNDTYFSGVVIKISEDGESYQVGTFIA